MTAYMIRTLATHSSLLPPMGALQISAVCPFPLRAFNDPVGERRRGFGGRSNKRHQARVLAGWNGGGDIRARSRARPTKTPRPIREINGLFAAWYADLRPRSGPAVHLPGIFS